MRDSLRNQVKKTKDYGHSLQASEYSLELLFSH